MRIFKHRIFDKWAKNENLSNRILKEAIQEIEQGLFDAHLGEGLYKKRIARQGRGKRSGYRTFIAFKRESSAFFVYGFAKNEYENIVANKLESLRKLSQFYLEATDDVIDNAIKERNLIEVK